MHFKYLWKSSSYYPGSSEGLQQLPKQSPCVSAGHFQSVLQTKAITLFSKCKFDHIIPLLTTLQWFSTILLIQAVLPSAWHLAPAYFFQLYLVPCNLWPCHADQFQLSPKGIISLCVSLLHLDDLYLNVYFMYHILWEVFPNHPSLDWLPLLDVPRLPTPEHPSNIPGSFLH